jgi:DNA primase
MITRESIERVLDVDLIEILDKYNLQDFKKAGANYRCFSPFTPEKSPSFMASQTKQVWKCFSSGKGGNGPISFVMEKDRLTWIEAIEKVASLANIILQREVLTDEEVQIQSRIEKERAILQAAGDKYKKNLLTVADDHWAKQLLKARGYQDLTLEQFMIGYSLPNSNEITAPLKEKGRQEYGIKVGLIKEGDGGRVYDMFNDRIMFPIQDDRGRVISFGARASNEAVADKKPKYLNGPETSHYNKGHVLYGFYQSRAAIIKHNLAYLGEGYTDVIGFHDKEVQNIVATCGTAPLSPENLKKLKKICSHLVLVRDGDKAGLAATYRDIDLSLSYAFKVSVVEMPEGEDPDSISKREGQNLQEWLNEHTLDALYWKATKLRKEAVDPDQKSEAVTSIAESLFKIKDTIKRREYAKECAKRLKISSKDINARIDDLNKEKQAKIKLDKRIYESKKQELMTMGFPEDGDVEQYERDGYVISPDQMCVYFETDYNAFFKGTNFVLNPLFVIRSAKGEGKRLIEFSNKVGENTVFALNNKEISNFGQFKERIVDGFNFTFEGRVNNLHFTQFKNRLLYNFKTAHELYTLGQQPEEFYAFANGVVYNNEFFQVDEYGIVDVEIEGDEQHKLPAIKETFYSPAFSRINANVRQDNDAFEGVREFAFKESDINFNQWMDLMYKVYGDKAMVGIAFNMAAVFRDVIVNQFNFFPHLFLTGQRQSGKTQFAESLTNIFTPKKKGFDLNTGTMVGFFRMVSRIKNIAVALEEFTDQIHEIKFQTLKAAYDNRARETGAITGGDKGTTQTKVEAGCIILSQYLSTRDGNSLTSRSITMGFQETTYTPEQKLLFSKLKELERKGMTSILMELLKHRKEIKANLSAVIEELNRDLIKSIKGDYMERVLNNFVAIMAPLKILNSKFVLPFSWPDFYKYCEDMIVSSSDTINETDGTAKFWQTLEFLVDQKRIQNGVEFIIDPKASFKYSISRNEQKEHVNVEGHDILFLRLGKVHQDYVVETSRRKNEDPIGEATLRGYFASKAYFIGPVKAIHFDTGSGSCYAFDYTMMEKMGVVNLKRTFKVYKETATYPDPATFDQAAANGYAEVEEEVLF